jgi:hypothetical protein
MVMVVRKHCGVAVIAVTFGSLVACSSSDDSTDGTSGSTDAGGADATTPVFDAGPDSGDTGVDATSTTDASDAGGWVDSSDAGNLDGGNAESDGGHDGGTDASIMDASRTDAFAEDAAIDAALDASDSATDICVPTGSLTTPRAAPEATLLSSGKVLVVGGLDTSTGHILASAELYDPATGTFTSAGSMSTSRAGFALVTVANGKILAAGGLTDQGTTTSTADLYDPVAGSWSAAGSMSIGRVDVSAVALVDGRALVLGGWSQLSAVNKITGDLSYNVAPLATAELYDAASNTFILTGTMTVPRASPGITLLPNGNVLVVSGTTGLSPQFTATAEIYNTTTSDGGAAGTFTAVGSLPNGTAGVPAVATLNSGQAFVHFAGPTFLFDPSLNTFSVGPNDLISAGGGILLKSGDVFVAGNGFTTSTAVDQTEVYHAGSGAWQATGNLTVARNAPGLANLPGGNVLVMGGCQTSSCGSSVLASAEICTP